MLQINNFWHCNVYLNLNMRKLLETFRESHKRKPCEVNTGTCNTVILSVLTANINLQNVTGVYAMIIYLTSYLCKLMKKTAKEPQ